MENQKAIEHLLEAARKAAGLEARPALAALLSGPTGKTSAGYPFIADETFQRFLSEVPHLFQQGARLAEWLTALGTAVGDQHSGENLQDLGRSIRVLRNVVYTAGVTAPPDLWILRHVLSLHKTTGLLERIAAGDEVTIEGCAAELGLVPAHLQRDFSLLHSRAVLQKTKTGYRVGSAPQVQDLVSRISPLPEYPSDMVPILAKVFVGEPESQVDLADRFLSFPEVLRSLRSLRMTGHPERSEGPPYRGWAPGLFEVEAGFRLVPVVLALRTLGLTGRLSRGVSFRDTVPSATEATLKLLEATGLTGPNGDVTLLGARVFSRGPGPFGIIHAYHSYMKHLGALARGQDPGSWVARGENVAASQDANRKTFTLANDALDRFCADTGFRYRVFIEHAVGQGEATRQRFERSGAEGIAYFGADLEDAAIDKAVAAQKDGVLPPQMKFIRQADIGRPEVLLGGLEAFGASPSGAVMMVGNGFHEVRQASNDRMVAVLRKYREAGLVLIFTEESGLSDEDLLETGWNTYHAGFRYVHELSGQGLRPANDREGDEIGRYSWAKCARLAGYEVLDDYTTKTRTIFPTPKPSGYNPAISVTYFCVPPGSSSGLKGSEA